jgi:hypothetical protein
MLRSMCGVEPVRGCVAVFEIYLSDLTYHSRMTAFSLVQR